MPDLLASLEKYDLGHLHIVAGLWGIQLASNETQAAAEELAACLLDADLVAELTEALPEDTRGALAALLAGQGRVPWAEFTRRFGQVRDMGAGKRDREKPQLKPISPAETLFYRGLLARAFFDAGKGPQEYAYIPDDLFFLMSDQEEAEVRRKSAKPLRPGGPAPESGPLGRPASPGEHGEELPAGDALLDDATTLLAALRLETAPPETRVPAAVILGLLEAAGFVRKGAPQPEPVKRFLEAPRAEAMKMLWDSWLESETFNELRLLPGIVCEGQWSNQPQVTREFLLNLLAALPDGQWWSLPAFIRAVKEKYPDYQRPAGDYDSWFIKRASDGTYLRGFAQWDAVDGALILYFITGILHWLGAADLSKGKESSLVTAFRLTAPAGMAEEKGKILVASNGVIAVPRSFPRAVRYQLSRFGEWEEEKAETYRYRLTPSSLERAHKQG
ncbi:MAG: hypothetical protein ACM3QS_02910, partial [Bacteroidota bacterium]